MVLYTLTVRPKTESDIISLSDEKLQQDKKLQAEQNKLDQFIVQKKNITDIDTQKGFIRTKIALLVEIGELANELKTFKS